MEQSNSTKERLAGELKRLVREKPLNKISVRLLCQQCGINRGTFYYHFLDMMDLVEWIFRMDIAAPTKEYIRTGAMPLKGISLCLLQKAYEDRALYAQTVRFRNQNRPAEIMLQESVENWECLWERLKTEKMIPDRPIPEEQQEKIRFVLRYYGYAHYYVFLHWIQDGMRISPKEMAERMDTTAVWGLNTALKQILPQETSGEQFNNKN